MNKLTRRCVYCRPKWTWGIRPSSMAGRIIAAIWPPHILGPDNGPPYTDGCCGKATARIINDVDLAQWRRRWAGWVRTADILTDRHTFPRAWLKDYQAARRAWSRVETLKGVIYGK
jgi:hypothetical protein